MKTMKILSFRRPSGKQPDTAEIFLHYRFLKQLYSKFYKLRAPIVEIGGTC